MTPSSPAKPSATPVTQESTTVARPSRTSGDSPRTFTAWERVQIAVAAWLGWLAVWFIGRSLRWEVHGWEHWEAARRSGTGIIYTFWHREICAATWFWRKRGIVVMTSRNFDGEYIARIIQRHGYGAARGSSSRGATQALRDMIRSMRHGRDTAFTVDGPRGPRFTAKPGPVLLAKATGGAILCFHIVPARAWAFRRSWDQTEIPCPGSRGAVFIAPPVYIDREANEAAMERKLAEMQAALEGLMAMGREWRESQVASRRSKIETRKSKLGASK